MPVEVKLIRKKVRTVDSETGKIAKTSRGNPVDGGGWKPIKQGWSTARRQSIHINEATTK